MKFTFLDAPRTAPSQCGVRNREIFPKQEGGTVPEVISMKSLVVASKDNVSCSLGDEAAILHMRSGTYYGLDPVGARVWSLLEKPRTVEELRAALLEEYEVEPQRCEGDLLALLEKLLTEGLIEVRSE